MYKIFQISVKIQINTLKIYRKLFFTEQENAQFHKHQLQSEKPVVAKICITLLHQIVALEKFILSIT